MSVPKSLDYYLELYKDINVAIHKWLNTDRIPVVYDKAKFLMKQENDNLIVSYETSEEYPTFRLDDRGYLVMTYDRDRPLNLYINKDGYLVERSST